MQFAEFGGRREARGRTLGFALTLAVLAHAPALARDAATPVVAGVLRTCALTAAGGIKCWGWNSYGQLGDGSQTDRHIPVDVSGLGSGVTAIAVGGEHTCALTTAGGVKCWGRNRFGQLGDGTRKLRLTPVDVDGLASGVTAIAAGYDHTCAVTKAGDVLCWGHNKDGQLGDGTTTERHTPVAVKQLHGGATAITAGYFHTCILTDIGGVKCWGDNFYGEIGDGTTENRRAPVDVIGLGRGITAITARQHHSCVLTDGDGVKCWGWNKFGQLDHKVKRHQLRPVNVSGLTSNIAAVAAGGGHTCAITASEGAKCLGWNIAGQLGDGTTTERHTPVDVSGLAGVAAISAGDVHSCALIDTGAIKCWGWNFHGQLGDGTTSEQHTPVEVVGF